MSQNPFPKTTLDWAAQVLKKMDGKMRYGVQRAQEIAGIPYTVKDGQWVAQPSHWWTNGFWPAEMWQMYLETGASLYKDEAVRAEKLMDEALVDYLNLHHDVGFMWLINSGVHFAVDGDKESLKRTLFCANMLAGRYNPNGFIRAWNGKGREGWAIIDCMMNLPLLYFASEYTGDPRYRLIALNHVHTVQRCFIREDGSSHHIVCFDPETGKVVDTPTGQGYAPGTSWTRGQAWALYGFMLSYVYIGDESFLNTARNMADYFLKNMPEDHIPPVDFKQPKEPDLKDNCAGGIAACGLMELADALGDDPKAEEYRNAAVAMLRAMDEKCSDWTQKTPAILTMCTSAYHDAPGHHIAMNYGDYFFIEAMRRVMGEKRLLWRPLLKKGEPMIVE
jgi:unsaturated chondroitin disaccharide hydrolase